MSTSGSALTSDVLGRVRSAGFALSGICPAVPSTTVPAFRDWLNSSALGSLDYLREHIDVRLDVTRLVRGARSVIVVGDVYAARGEESPSRDPRSGRIARYARGDDYHDIIKERLHALCDTLRAEHPAHQFRAFTDIEPVLEREHALRAGLGWVGKNTMLIHPRLGSFFFLGGIVTTLELTPPADQRAVPDHCGTCTRCIDACPTRAITPYKVDASRCISALTIEQRGPIDPTLHAEMNDWLYGCDICQEVCPHNSLRPPAFVGDLSEPNPAYTPHRDSFDLLDVLDWTPQDRTARLRRSAMKRATLDMWKRNAVIAAANFLRQRDDPALRARLTDLAWDAKESPLARATARQVLGL